MTSRTVAAAAADAASPPGDAPGGGRPRPPRWTDTHVTVEMRGKLRRRHIVNGILVGLVSLAALVATLPLIFILFHLIKLGGSSVQWHFFTNMPKPVGESGGGMANAIVGT